MLDKVPDKCVVETVGILHFNQYFASDLVTEGFKMHWVRELIEVGIDDYARANFEDETLKQHTFPEEKADERRKTNDEFMFDEFHVSVLVSLCVFVGIFVFFCRIV